MVMKELEGIFQLDKAENIYMDIYGTYFASLPSQTIALI